MSEATAEPRETVLVIDDDEANCRVVARYVERMGFRVVEAYDGLMGISSALSERPVLVITDLEMPDITGLDVIREMRREDPDAAVMVMTGYASIQTAVDAMKEGAVDYLQKPVQFDHIRLVVEKVMERRRLILENRRLREQLDDRYGFGNLVGHSEAMRAVYRTVEKVAPTEANVMICGESGTGKELIARAIHVHSPRSAEEFVAVDCVAIPSHLIEAELFGHEKGAFTGAASSREGLLETADGSTFFMDEVTELEVDLQAKLLRVLQERQFRRVGGRELLEVDIRVVSATNRDPEQAVAEGRLREDLLYRLNVIPIHVPPLRERAEDIPLLVQHFLETLGDAPGVARSISLDAMDCLQAHPWPGNVRELRNMVERLSILSAGERIEVEDLPENLRGGRTVWEDPDEVAHLPFKAAKRKWLQGFERRYLEQALVRHGWNVRQAAAACGVNRRTFHRLIVQYGLSRPKR